MVDKFEVGKYYQWIGPPSYNENWNGEMEQLKDGSPRQVLRIIEQSTQRVRVQFNGMNVWNYAHCKQNFMEVDAKREITLGDLLELHIDEKRSEPELKDEGVALQISLLV